MMKNLVTIAFMLLTGVFTMINGQKKSVIALLTSIEIDIQTGTKSLVNDKVVCLGGGLCGIKIKAGIARSNGIGVDEVGDIYLMINENAIDNSLKRNFELKEDVDISDEDIGLLNTEIKKINPDAKPFLGLKKGYLLRPEKLGEIYYIKIS